MSASPIFYESVPIINRVRSTVDLLLVRLIARDHHLPAEATEICQHRLVEGNLSFSPTFCVTALMGFSLQSQSTRIPVNRSSKKFREELESPKGYSLSRSRAEYRRAAARSLQKNSKLLSSSGCPLTSLALPSSRVSTFHFQ